MGRFRAVPSAVASDAFASALKAALAVKLPTDVDLDRERDEHARLERRRAAIEAELQLRELDAQRAREAKQRAALVAR